MSILLFQHFILFEILLKIKTLGYKEQFLSHLFKKQNVEWYWYK